MASVPSEAEVVRRIFRDFAAGVGPRTIARALNEEGIAGPNGKPWGDTTIRGHVKRGTGLVNNELYIGRLVWNRLRYVKDPSTGKRVSRLNPESAWITTEVPELRSFGEGGAHRSACHFAEELSAQHVTAGAAAVEASS